jgi:hypothetical protein
MTHCSFHLQMKTVTNTFISECVKLLLSWFGDRLRMSLVGRHESNYVERTNKEVLRFLSTLVNTERLKKIWAKPHVMGTVQFLLNEAINKETGVSPFEYVFGSVDYTYFKLPEAGEERVKTGTYLQILNDNLKVIREEAMQVQTSEQLKRKEKGAGENEYQIGDFVLRKVRKMVDKESKLQPNYLGPYEIISTYKADITCRHLVTEAVQTFHMSQLKMAFTSREEAYKAALVDYDQFVIQAFLQDKGDPERRTSNSIQGWGITLVTIF